MIWLIQLLFVLLAVSQWQKKKGMQMIAQNVQKSIVMIVAMMRCTSVNVAVGIQVIVRTVSKPSSILMMLVKEANIVAVVPTTS